MTTTRPSDASTGGGAAGLVTVVPALRDVGLVFGLGLIAWFAWLGVALVRSDR